MAVLDHQAMQQVTGLNAAKFIILEHSLDTFNADLPTAAWDLLNVGL